MIVTSLDIRSILHVYFQVHLVNLNRVKIKVGILFRLEAWW